MKRYRKGAEKISWKGQYTGAQGNESNQRRKGRRVKKSIVSHGGTGA